MVRLEPQIRSSSQTFSFLHSLHLFLSQAFKIFFRYSVVQPKRISASNNSFLKEEKGTQFRICISHVPNKDPSLKIALRMDPYSIIKLALGTLCQLWRHKDELDTHPACQALTV